MTKKDRVYALLDGIYEILSPFSKPVNKEAWKEKSWKRWQLFPDDVFESRMQFMLEVLAMPSED